ncbi:MAG: lysylphosphatidylglycerol synthase transmembrane domain-containing protein [Luteimonas sp.]
MNRHRLLFVLRIAVTVIALVALFGLYRPGDVLPLAAHAGAIACTLAVVAYAVCIVVSAFKWSLIARDVPFATLLHAVLAACFYALLPSGQLGAELGKAFIVKAKRPQAENILASIVFDKIAAVAGLLLIGVLASALSSHRVPSWQTALLIGLASCCAAALFAAPWVVGIGRRLKLPASLFSARDTALRMVETIQTYGQNRSLLLRCIVLGAISQCAVIAVYVVFAAALGLHVGTAELVGAVVIANLATLLPISVGGFGVREAGLTALLAGQYGVPGEQALALSLLPMSVFLLFALAGALLESHAVLRAAFRPR